MRERRLIWERIQNEAPEIAEFLLEVNAEFGKPVRTAVWIGDERVL